MLDCEEYYLQQRLLNRENTGRADDNSTAVANRLSYFKDNTLPTAHSFDELGKLTIVSILLCFYDCDTLKENSHNKDVIKKAPLSTLIIDNSKIVNLLSHIVKSSIVL